MEPEGVIEVSLEPYAVCLSFLGKAVSPESGTVVAYLLSDLFSYPHSFTVIC